MSSYVNLVSVTSQVPSFATTAAFPAAGQQGRLAYSVLDASVYFDDGASWVLISQTGTDVTAATGFGVDNSLIRADGTSKGLQASGITIDDSNNVSGFGTLNGKTIAGFVEDADFGANGVMVRTASGTYTNRTVTGTANQVTVTNGDGVSGNPTLALPQSIHTAATPTFASLTLSANAFLTGIVTATAADAGTTTIAATTTIEIVTPNAASVPAHTIVLPSAPANGQLLTIANGHDTRSITALTLNGGTNTIVGALTDLATTRRATYVYRAADTTWYRVI